MSEEYWLEYHERERNHPNKQNIVGFTLAQMEDERRTKKHHHLELYSMCKSDNPYIRMMRRSPNITLDTVAELICRGVACDLQYCLGMQKIAAENPRKKIDLGGCQAQIKTLRSCIEKETTRLKQKEQELKDLVESGKMPDSIQLKAKEMAQFTKDSQLRIDNEVAAAKAQNKPQEVYI